MANLLLLLATYHACRDFLLFQLQCASAQLENQLTAHGMGDKIIVQIIIIIMDDDEMSIPFFSSRVNLALSHPKKPPDCQSVNICKAL